MEFTSLNLGSLGFNGFKCAGNGVELSDANVENIVKRSYQYVAMYNVNNKFALKQGGWNACVADTKLKDHTMREIARPNNDTLYMSCLLDLRNEPIILEIPALDSDYISLMNTGYDHYVNIPMTSRLGDFGKPEKMLLYSDRTEGYKGEKVEGMDRYFKATGDFISAVFRVMPHASDPDRFNRIVEQMKSLRMLALSEYQGGEAKPIADIDFPPVGKTDADIFENNLLEVMQFVFNHTTFDPNDDLDQAVLAAYEPLGVTPGRTFSPSQTADIDGAAFRKVAEAVASENLADTSDPEFMKKNILGLFMPKGEMTLERLVHQSVIGPIGMPAAEAVYPALSTIDGAPMNAMHDYEIRMTKEALPPAKVFWSVTLYDVENGFFIPNDHKKYSVGENGGMKLDADGGITIAIAAEKPKDVPEENWLPIERGDYAIGPIMRLYVPDIEKYQNWIPPKAEQID